MRLPFARASALEYPARISSERGSETVQNRVQAARRVRSALASIVLRLAMSILFLKSLCFRAR